MITPNPETGTMGFGQLIMPVEGNGGDDELFSYYYQAWGIDRSTDGGVTWSVQNAHVSDYHCLSMIFDPSDSDHMFTTRHDSVSPWDHHVMESTDRGASWTDLADPNEFHPSGSSGPVYYDPNFDSSGTLLVMLGGHNAGGNLAVSLNGDVLKWREGNLRVSALVGISSVVLPGAWA
jgi:hypothetical protein